MHARFHAAAGAEAVGSAVSASRVGSLRGGRLILFMHARRHGGELFAEITGIILEAGVWCMRAKDLPNVERALVVVVSISATAR